MNKYQKALEFLRSENVTAWGNDKFELLYFHLDNIEELVDKATPKKPIKDEVQDIRYVTKYICPNCGGKFTGKISDYCYHCGQAFDWSDEND